MIRRKDKKRVNVAVKVDLANYKDVVAATIGLLQPEKIRRARLSGVVSPAASMLALPEKVAIRLGVPVVGKVKVGYANHRIATRKRVQDVWLRIQGRDGVFSAILEPRRSTVRIGSIVIDFLDFMVDYDSRRLRPRHPKGIVVEL